MARSVSVFNRHGLMRYVLTGVAPNYFQVLMRHPLTLYQPMKR